MKLTVDLSELWAAVDKMEVKVADFSMESELSFEEIKIDTELSHGIEIPFSDVVFDPKSGLASYKGRQVLLYINDHSHKGVAEVISSPDKGNKYHISHCSTLENMHQMNRSERYVVTNRLDGSFKIFDSYREGHAELKVCKNCLKMLNYKNYRSNRTKVFEQFDISKFFSDYSSFFKFLPKNTQQNSGYTKDWSQVSKDYRDRKGFRCEQCRVDLSKQPRLLHTHHKNGVKSDNSASNLEALCIDCHKKQPFHGHMKALYPSTHRDIQLINELRQVQGLTILSSWSQVEGFADTALNGLIPMCAKRSLPLPTSLSSLLKGGGVGDMVWRDHKVVVLIQQEEPNELRESGWRSWSVRGAIEQFNEFAAQFK